MPLLNAGTLLAGLQIWLPAALLIGRIAEALGAVLFVVGSWRRVKPSGAFK